MVKTVLVVDDVDEMRELLVEWVKAAWPSAKIRQATTAAEAEREIQSFRPDVAILDEVLPTGGVDRLIQSFLTAGTQVVLVTSYMAPGSEALVPAGVRGRLLKPDWKDLSVEALKRIVG